MQIQPKFQDRDLPEPKKHNLIASDRVEGTPVRSLGRDRIGNIERVMIDKISGKVSYAVLSFGGFLGLGQKHLPIPWERLKYNPDLESYEIEITDQELKNAPSYEADHDFDWGDRSNVIKVHDYYRFGGI